MDKGELYLETERRRIIMKQFMDKDFLLNTETARKLYHDYAAKQPIIDYHCHLSAKEICENKPAYDLTELWLLGDHYKWRIMRADGADESLVTGNAGNYEKFLAFAKCLPYAIGNPVYHWAHLELQRYFGIYEVLNEKTAPMIWEKTKEILSDGKHTPQYFIRQSNVYALCTTEGPSDTLKYHQRIAEEGLLDTKVIPAFRPDNELAVEKKNWKTQIDRLSDVSGVRIMDFESLTQALKLRMDEFAKVGCVASDHGFEAMPYMPAGRDKADAAFKKAYAGEVLTPEEEEGYKTELMLWLGRQYAERGWAMELHVNAIRSCNTEAVARIGEASGFDSVCDHPMALKISSFMNALEKTGELPKTILFSLNESDNMVFASMLGNFQDSSTASKIQLGTAWWFQDNIDGMEKQMRILANEGLLGHFIGMLTDSRSFLSYPRHEYFRRILCNLIGDWVENGLYPYDEDTLAMLIDGICYNNARNYLGL